MPFDKSQVHAASIFDSAGQRSELARSATDRIYGHLLAPEQGVVNYTDYPYAN